MTITERNSISHTPQIEEREEIINEAEVESTPLAWLTLESLLYGVIFIIGLALRLWDLGLYPLTDSEALQSLIAFQILEPICWR